ncbi:unnamed protein product [Moneuplotes crassus]|uniref:Uncharacterized protein n=1 Tax=Euplotes crassus TaxID=5936 RepID=A0AAD1XS66_EUPCR|nr:unnamed protein product [Moneuplotes crassus]
MGKLRSRIYHSFTSIDIFTQKFTLSFKGQKAYATIFGTILSIIIFGICGFYGFRLVTSMLNRTMLQTNINKIRTDFGKNPINTTLNEAGLYLAFSWVGKAGDQDVDLLEERLASAFVHVAETVPQGEDYIENPIFSFEIEKCNQTSMPLDPNDPSFAGRHGHTLYCFKRNDLMRVIQREISKGRNLRFMLYFQPCPNGVCEDSGKSSIEYYNFIYLTVISKYYDDSDPLSPIKTYIHDQISVPSSKGSIKLVDCKLSRNRYVVNDWHSIITRSRKGEFFDIDGCTYQELKRGDGSTFVILSFNVNDFIQTYETTVISFLEVLGQIGGLFEILYLSSSFLVKIVAIYLYRRDIDKVENKVKNHKEWFTFPVQIQNDPIEKEETTRRRLKGEGLRYMGLTKNKVNPEENVNTANDRSTLYQDKQSKFTAQVKRIKEICRNSRILKEIEEELDVTKISRSLTELKLYVSYLMDKDKNTDSNKVDKLYEKYNTKKQEEEKKEFPSSIEHSNTYNSYCTREPYKNSNDAGLPMISLNKIANSRLNFKSRDPIQESLDEEDSVIYNENTDQNNPAKNQGRKSYSLLHQKNQKN